ncbi:hypothetical protein [Falsihalocynthiibacter arcticus]|nr:hypothetical protein [Falsihalocynthiibacter arcticus]
MHYSSERQIDTQLENLTLSASMPPFLSCVLGLIGPMATEMVV